MSVSGTLSGNAIRKKFIQYFTEKRGHKEVPSASLVPNNPTVLLTPAGMLPFVPIFLGIEPPLSPPRAVSSQKCARVSGKASDLENVGRTPRHHTFFEMLGNFSFGDYFKKEVIPWAWEFLTEEMKLPKDRLWISVFTTDFEARDIWRDVVGIPENRIIFRDEKDNFWGPPGPTGPCGPCSEIYYDWGTEPHGDPQTHPELLDTDRFMEIWNLVFMELFKDGDGNFTPLEKKNIDTGMGLERIVMVVQGKENTFETDLLYPIVNQAAKMSGISYKKSEITDVALKIIADHSRMIAFAIGDGITPSNEGRGYIIRMILRR
ncbi:MAG: alanine--tRNA ligase, partial [Cyanobacteria bacterium]|nr:alanine--tRNA ligase [Cyanobacteriota bacterium]